MLNLIILDRKWTRTIIHVPSASDLKHLPLLAYQIKFWPPNSLSTTDEILFFVFYFRTFYSSAILFHFSSPFCMRAIVPQIVWFSKQSRQVQGTKRTGLGPSDIHDRLNKRHKRRERGRWLVVVFVLSLLLSLQLKVISLLLLLM